MGVFGTDIIVDMEKLNPRPEKSFGKQSYPETRNAILKIGKFYARWVGMFS